MRYIFISVFVLFFNLHLFSQMSDGSIPHSTTHQIDFQHLKPTSINPPSLSQLAAEDQKRASNGELERNGVILKTNITLQNSGKWVYLCDGDRLWVNKILAVNAQAISLFYENIFLPKGSELYIFSSDKKQIIGAFNHYNTPKNTEFATEMINSDALIIEYFEPKSVKNQGIININEIGYHYRLIPSFLSKNEKDFGDSGACEVNVNCSEGGEWTDARNSVVRILIKTSQFTSWCSGSVVNTTRQDFTPYVLTAQHCALEANGNLTFGSNINQWIFYFNYQSSGCAGVNFEAQIPFKTMVGATAISDSDDEGGLYGSDFLLLQLKENIPEDYNVYYAGWNKTGDVSGSGVCIHHPSGDIKKISTFNSNTISTSAGFESNTHWRAFWVQTDNGWGVTEGGSSGSPLFDENGRIVGTLTGGSSFCGASANESNDEFGKFSYHWDQNGGSAATRLRNWLDPDNLGYIWVDGSYYEEPDIISAVSSLDHNNTFVNFSPNPTSGWIFIENNNTLAYDQVLVFGVAGDLKKSFDLKDSPPTYSLDLTDLQGGIYFVRLNKNGKMVSNNKVVVE